MRFLRRRPWVVVPVGLAALVVAAPAAISKPVTPGSAALVSGPLRAPGGAFLVDSYGRAVILHGVNAVYKLAPYELIQAPGKPWNFDATDAKEMASLGFDVVRLGITWQGLEPGTLPASDPAVCSEGAGISNQYDAKLVSTYLQRLDQTVTLLGSYGIYSLIDMHQDVYNNSSFGGDGEPNWAVCTGGAPNKSEENPYLNPAVGVAFDHFWDNDVVGGLQNQYDQVWSAVASHFSVNKWVLGYDVFNEPYSPEIFTAAGNSAFDARLECFYTGTAHPGDVNGTPVPLLCPPADPGAGAVARIHAADPNHLIFYEPDVGNDFGEANYIGAMPFPGLVLNFHDYCLANGATCPSEEQYVFEKESSARSGAASPQQPGGPAWFLSEFGGGGDNYANLATVTADANSNLVGWAYWQWKQYNDPYGGTDEGIVDPNGQMDPGKTNQLAQTYAQAIAGVPRAMSFDPSTGDFSLTYTPNPAIQVPTVIFVPLAFHYRGGYCARVSGGRITSAADAAHLLIAGQPHAETVQVTVRPGSC